MNNLDRIAHVSGFSSWDNMASAAKELSEDEGLKVMFPAYIINWNKEHREELTYELFKSIRDQGLKLTQKDDSVYVQKADIEL